MNVFIAGGTGLLGWHAARELIDRGHKVRSAALPDLPDNVALPRAMKLVHADLFALDAKALSKLFEGSEALVYALGPDDRETPKAPAYLYFHERLVMACERIVAAARDAGVNRCVILGSYYATFDRLWPHKRLAEIHPYVRCRIEQAERAVAAGGERMAVSVLELPYIFGTMPGRVPLWKKLFINPIRRMPVVLYPEGGSAMTTAQHVAQAIAGALERGDHDQRFPIGDENLTWDEMLQTMLDALGQPDKRIVHVPALAGMAFGWAARFADARDGRESGLNHPLLFRDMMGERMYLDPLASASLLGHARGGVREAITQTVQACLAHSTQRAARKAAPRAEGR